MARLNGLPEPTTDLDRARADLGTHGYCLVADALDDDQLTRLRADLVAVARQEVEAGRAYVDGGGANQRVWQLLNRGQAFCDLAVHPVGLALVDHLVGGYTAYGAADDGLPQFLLSSLTANIAGPGGAAMALHSDQGYIPLPWPDMPLVANIGWMLDDFTAANGATRIVPGSHRRGALPGPDVARLAVPAEGPAGTALVFDGRTWHGTGPNTTIDQRRHGVLAYYCRPWIRQQENSTTSVAAGVVDAAPPVLRRLLGFDRWHTLGMIGGLPPDGALPIGAATTGDHR